MTKDRVNKYLKSACLDKISVFYHIMSNQIDEGTPESILFIFEESQYEEVQHIEKMLRQQYQDIIQGNSQMDKYWKKGFWRKSIKHFEKEIKTEMLKNLDVIIHNATTKISKMSNKVNECCSLTFIMKCVGDNTDLNNSLSNGQACMADPDSQHYPYDIQIDLQSWKDAFEHIIGKKSDLENNHDHCLLASQPRLLLNDFEE